MAVTFNIQFRISVATKVIRLTDTSTGFTYGKGCFKVEFPNGVVRNLPDFSAPDISTAGNFIDIPCEVNVSGNVVTGSYIISYAVINNLSTGQTPLVRTFDFNWVEPANGITNFSDVITPEVVFKDLTSYSPIGSFTGALTRTITGSFPSTSEVSGSSPITSTSTNTVTVVSGANYYEGSYTPTSNVSVAYTHTSNAWLTILYTRTFSKTFTVKKCPNQLELVTKINAYRVIIDAYKETNDTQFNLLSEQYDLVIALYSHLIARYSTNTQDGSETILRELLSILEPYSGAYTYQATKMLPFELTSSGTNSFNISDGTNVDAVQLGSTLTFASGNASLVPIVTNNNVTYSPTFGTLINTFAQGNDARFHNPVTIGTANGLSISTQALSLAAATTGSAGAMTASDKTKLDGIASGATANVGTVTSVALTVPAAFTVTGSPITTAGTLAIAAAGNSAQYITGAGALATLNTLNVPENTNLYFTTSRARTSISLTTTGTSGAATYDNTTGVLNIPNYIGGVTSFNTRTGAIVLSGTDVTTALSFTPYNATNPAGYISSITSGNVTGALGYTPENAANKGIANGYASLDGGGLVPSTQLPSYVDDVLEYTNLATFPASGTTGKIYVALDTNKIYRWSGTTYIEVSPTVGTIWGGITGTLSNQTDLQTALNLKYDASNPAGYTTNVGTVTSVSALTLGTTGTDVSSTVATGTTTPVITLNIPTASASNRGALSSTDWTTFNNKANALSGTTNTIPKFTSATAIGNSNITDSGSLVTIASPLTLSGSVTGVGNLSNYTVTATAGSAISKKITSTLIASANSDTLVGLDINPTFTNGAFTGVTNAALRVNGAILNFGSLPNIGTASQPFGTFFITNVRAGGDLSLGSGFASSGDKGLVMYSSTRNITIQNGGTFTDAGYKLDVVGTTRFTGTTASDTAPLGSELAAVTGTGTNWTLAGTNLNVGGYSHTTGSVVPLTTSLAAVNGTYYQITYTITGRTAGSITIAYGGTSTAGITASGNTGPLASSTAVLTITPTTDFNGTVVLSIKSIGTSSASSTFANSAGTSNIEVRASNITTNTFIGLNAGSRNTTGITNTFVGQGAGQNNTTGITNSFFGTSAGLLNTTGAYNSALGDAALKNTTTGGDNVAIGQGAGGLNTTGQQNCYLGSGTIGNTTGSGNIMLGVYAGRFIANSSTIVSVANNSIFIGNTAKALADSQTNQIVIGYNSTGLGSNTTVLGNSSTVTTAIYGNLVLGSTTDAGYRLDVTGTARVSGVLTLSSTISNGTYAYTLPSATGTLALTSALSGYLPLTGGTLTGALAGTSATFSGNGSSFGDVTVGGYPLTVQTNISEQSIKILGKVNNSDIQFFNSTGATFLAHIGIVSTDFVIGTGTSGTTRLTIASTGAATFSSSVIVGGGTTSTSKLTILATTGVAAPGSPTLGIYDASNPTYGFDFDLEGVSTGDLYLSRLVAGTRTAVLQLSRATGAATFSSDVTVSTGVRFGGGSTNLNYYEEGTWTPIIGGEGGQSGQTYNGTATGYYRRIGRLVTVTFRVVLANKGTITGSAAIKGLPFTSDASGVSHAGGVTYFEGLATSWSSIFLMVTVGSTYATIDGVKSAATLTTRATTSDIGNSTQFNGSFTYFV